MSVQPTNQLPMGDSPNRAKAKETIWRMAALALEHPTPEVFEAIQNGDFHAAFSAAWAAATGINWPRLTASETYDSFEAGYIEAFLHGRGGKPTAALLAGDHEHILKGLARPVFMLNIVAFYKHFGLQAAVEDLGKKDEPDHLASMLEFMAVLCHFEARALSQGKDASGYRRAQRDFLCRYLDDTLDTVAGLLRKNTIPLLDPTLFQLLQDLTAWSELQISELEVRVGPFRDLDSAKPDTVPAEPAAQNLWG